MKKSLLVLCLCMVACSGCKDVALRPPDDTSSVARKAAAQYLIRREPVEKPVIGSLQVLLDQPFGDGQIVIFAYAMGPGNQVGRPGDQVVTLLHWIKMVIKQGAERNTTSC